MNGHKGNSEFCFPETLNEVEGKQNLLFPAGPVIKCFVIPPNSELEKKNCEETVCFTPAGSQICRCFKEHDLRVESSCYCFPRELMSSVRPWEFEFGQSNLSDCKSFAFRVERFLFESTVQRQTVVLV